MGTSVSPCLLLEHRQAAWEPAVGRLQLKLEAQLVRDVGDGGERVRQVLAQGSLGFRV